MAAVRMASPPVLLLLPLLWAVLCRGLERSEDNEVAPLEDAWDCITTWSLPCIQKKLLVFVDRVGRLKQVDLLGDAVSVVRVGGEPTGPPVTEEGLQARLLPGDDDAMGALLQHAVLSFLDSHVVRVSLPDGITASTGGRALSNTFEFNLGRAFQEARGKKKKNMMMLGAMMMAKTAMLGKMLMLLIKFKALKALLLSVLALGLAKIQLFKSLKGGGGKGGKETFIIIKGGKGGGGAGGHGGGGYSSGGPSDGGGWSDSGSSAGWSSGGGGSTGGWQSDSGGGAAGWPSSGGGGGSSGGWSSGGGGGGGGSGWSGGGGGGGSSSGWGRNYDAHWLAYRGQANNNTAT